MRVKFNNSKSSLKGASDVVILQFCNDFLREEVQGYSDINLGRLTKIHPKKIWMFQGGHCDLLIDDLKKIARVMDIKMQVYED